ncbi:hypothetical protein OF83DRAFT_1168819 [Amylostereum chailletii]|nr:hypothetical protein OF83DRAFT_1168819 [Amylostereum chailletii]
MAYCDRCERWFPHDRALQQHEENSNNHWLCVLCNIDFPSWLACKEHYVQSPRHHYCQRCDEHFGSARMLNNHLDEEHWFCQDHNKARLVFDNEKGLKEHYVQSSEHAYCQHCDTHYRTHDGLFQHAQQSHFACTSCRSFYATHVRLIAHKKQQHHYCSSCDRIFESASNLASHLASSKHTPRTIRCPARGCERAFPTMSALIAHAESDSRAGGLTRAYVNRYIVERDRTNLITNPSRLIGGPGGYRPPTTTTMWATDRSWNGWEWECVLCHRTFAAKDALNKHLQSPRHAEKIYRCPGTSCRAEFAALSALVRHVEDEGCDVKRFVQVQGAIDGLVHGMRALTW